jgi:hypothetical protein
MERTSMDAGAGSGVGPMMLHARGEVSSEPENRDTQFKPPKMQFIASPLVRGRGRILCGRR